MADQKTIIVTPDLMVFPVDPDTLEPLRCSTYDPWALTDPVPGARYIPLGEWDRLRAEMRERDDRRRWGRTDG